MELIAALLTNMILRGQLTFHNISGIQIFIQSYKFRHGSCSAMRMQENVRLSKATGRSYH